MVAVSLPDIREISARGFSGGADWKVIARIYNANIAEVGGGYFATAAEIEGWLSNASDVDIDSDFILVDVGAETVAYALTSRYVEHSGRRIYRHNCKVDPPWRDKGIGTALLQWAIARHRDDAAELGDGILQTEAERNDAALAAMLSAAGYEAVTHDALLVRPDLENIPDRALPDGLEMRPVEETHLRAIFEADAEAFKDHWGSRPAAEGDWKAFLAFPHRDESMWKIAWDGDRVVGQVRGYVNPEENEALGHQRGWCEDISTARDWRGRGVASALIVATLREFKERGFEESALGVHVDNPTGAYSLYTGLGFAVVSGSSTYERPLAD
jgi:ribosomal protein S18 acetylase RimI-like enzyme